MSGAGSAVSRDYRRSPCRRRPSGSRSVPSARSAKAIPTGPVHRGETSSLSEDLKDCLQDRATSRRHHGGTLMRTGSGQADDLPAVGQQAEPAISSPFAATTRLVAWHSDLAAWLDRLWCVPALCALLTPAPGAGP